VETATYTLKFTKPVFWYLPLVRAPPEINAGFVVESGEVGYFVSTEEPGYIMVPNQESAELIDDLL
jgi:hypothetical protein